MAGTVGELKKLLEQYPDDMAIAILDADADYVPGVELRFAGILGLFEDKFGDDRYFSSRPFFGVWKWLKDEEVLILG